MQKLEDFNRFKKNWVGWNHETFAMVGSVQRIAVGWIAVCSNFNNSLYRVVSYIQNKILRPV